MTKEQLQNTIETASRVVGKTWPLYSFVTSNPLSGYEKAHFKKAAGDAEHLLGGKSFPKASVFREAWEQGEINNEELIALLSEHHIKQSPEECLTEMASHKSEPTQNTNGDLDRMVLKWLMAFLDEGLAEWELPNKSEGFFDAWRHLIPYDNQVRVRSISEIPKTSEEVLLQILEKYSEEECLTIIQSHLAALPGWTGYIKYRAEENSIWQQNCKITLEDYLAVRLWIANHIDANILPTKPNPENRNSSIDLSYVWLKAWEKSWQNKLETGLKNKPKEKKVNALPEAQLVFCIDTRSELIRRNVESKGHYETFGYAGFFGIAMDYKPLDNEIIRKSCPPILNSAYSVSEFAQADKGHELTAYKKRLETQKFTDYFLKRMKNMLPSAFGYVEGSGVFYGISLLARTLIPGQLYHPDKDNKLSHEGSCEPKINPIENKDTSDDGIPIEEKVAIVKSAFALMGWRQFSPLVLFVGHGSHSANNPFGSSLDCGACAASPGRHNARMLAKLANLPEVRTLLKEEEGITIPKETVFIGAEHNTTTDEIVVFDSEVPNSHEEKLDRLKIDLQRAQQTATEERLGSGLSSVKAAHKKTNDWSETRPEWGLAKNAGFIVGPRSLTKTMNLNGNCFLHSYNWELDTTGGALEGIMQGPMVVTQWINNHYYFSSVDNETYGGGSKITHNITGKFGVVQGNGGDLKIGLPLQSVNETDEKAYHQPLRLSVLIQAPKQRIQEILNKNENLKSLLDNEWIYLLVMDPTDKNVIVRYQKGMNWVASTQEAILN
jgi:uncharacterized protein YbcC (UPF0753/DUF2309 family)